MKVNLFILVVLYVVYFGVLLTLGYLSYKMPSFLKGKSGKSSEENEEIKKMEKIKNILERNSQSIISSVPNEEFLDGENFPIQISDLNTVAIIFDTSI